MISYVTDGSHRSSQIKIQSMHSTILSSIMTSCGSESFKTPMIEIDENHDNDNVSLRWGVILTFVNIIKTARSMISDCYVTHIVLLSCHM